MSAVAAKVAERDAIDVVACLVSSGQLTRADVVRNMWAELQTRRLSNRAVDISVAALALGAAIALLMGAAS